MKKTKKWKWNNFLNNNNKIKESTIFIQDLDKNEYHIYTYIVDGESKYTLECVGPFGCMFSGSFKSIASAKKFAQKEILKRFNEKYLKFI